MRDEKYDKAAFKELGITHEDISNTCNEATKLMRRLRGRVLLYDLISLFLIWGFLWVVIALCIVLGLFIGFLIPTIIFLIYMWAIGSFAFWTRRRSTRYLRLAHFVLAVYLRAENNRYYERKHVMVRPGYLAKWIEFSIDRRYLPESVRQIIFIFYR